MLLGDETCDLENGTPLAVAIHSLPSLAVMIDVRIHP